jgi:hypothetical protein
MTIKRFYIYRDIKTGQYYIAPNKVLLGFILRHFSKDFKFSEQYLTRFIHEIGFFNDDLSIELYDKVNTRELIHLKVNQFKKEFKESAFDLMK